MRSIQSFCGFVVALLVCMCLAGCAGPPAQQLKAGDPTTRMVQNADRDAHLRNLRDLRRQTQDEIDQLETMLLAFRRQNPDLQLQTVWTQDLKQISQALVAAQLATIDARTKYASGHPAVLSAMRHEEEVFRLFEQARDRLTRVDEQAEQFARITSQLQQKQDLLRHLDERIAYLEDSRI